MLISSIKSLCMMILWKSDHQPIHSILTDDYIIYFTTPLTMHYTRHVFIDERILEMTKHNLYRSQRLFKVLSHSYLSIVGLLSASLFITLACDSNQFTETKSRTDIPSSEALSCTTLGSRRTPFSLQHPKSLQRA